MTDNTIKFLNKSGLFLSAIGMMWYGCAHNAEIPTTVTIFYWQVVAGLLAMCGIRTGDSQAPPDHPAKQSDPLQPSTENKNEPAA